MGRTLAGIAAALAFGICAAGAGSGTSARADDPSLAPGDTVPSFTAKAVDGSTKTVSYPKGSHTVLLFFLASCPKCHKMIPEWNRAFERKPKGVAVFGVVMDQEPPGFFGTMSIQFPLLRSPGGSFRQDFKVNQVPFTVRVGEAGKVEAVGQGIMDPIGLGKLFHP